MRWNANNALLFGCQFIAILIRLQMYLFIGSFFFRSLSSLTNTIVVTCLYAFSLFVLIIHICYYFTLLTPLCCICSEYFLLCLLLKFLYRFTYTSTFYFPCNCFLLLYIMSIIIEFNFTLLFSNSKCGIPVRITVTRRRLISCILRSAVTLGFFVFIEGATDSDLCCKSFRFKIPSGHCTCCTII